MLVLEYMMNGAEDTDLANWLLSMGFQLAAKLLWIYSAW